MKLYLSYYLNLRAVLIFSKKFYRNSKEFISIKLLGPILLTIRDITLIDQYLPLSPPGQMHDSEMPAFCAVLQPAGPRSQPAPQHRLPSPCGFPPAPGSHLPIGLRPGPAFWGAQARIPGHLNTPRALYLEVLSQAVFKIQFLFIDFLFRMSLILKSGANLKFTNWSSLFWFCFNFPFLGCI